MVSSVTKIALFSRVVAFAVQFISNWLLPDHDADAFRLRPLRNPTGGDKLVHLFFEGFNKWDGSYYLTIAEDGYTQPQMFVFFPLFPAMVRSVAIAVSYASCQALSFRSCLMISSWLTNTILFAIAANLLQKLAVRILKDDKMAVAAGALFCFNPASVFMSANYSESLFSALTFGGMLAFQDQLLVLSALLFGLSSATRSNGVVSFGFVIYYWTQELIRRTLISVSTGNTNVCLFVVLQSLQIAPILTGLATLTFGPFLLFQVYSFAQVCHSQVFTIPTTFFQYILPVNSAADYIPSSPNPEWCQKTIPIPYSNIQAEVWEVGFFHYFRFKKIPNFLLAVPVIILSLRAIVVYCQRNWEYVKWIGLLPKRKTWDKYAKSQGYYNEESFLHLAHLFFLLLFGSLFIHIEVLTRFLFSSCPIIVMFAAHLFTSGPNSSSLKSLSPLSIGSIIKTIPSWSQSGPWSKFVLLYFPLYFIVGLVLHCNFLPWT